MSPLARAFREPLPLGLLAGRLDEVAGQEDGGDRVGQERARPGENVFLVAHHPHDDLGPVPLADVLEIPGVVGSLRAQRRLRGPAELRPAARGGRRGGGAATPLPSATFTPVADARVSSSSPAQNFGASTTLRAR